MLLAFTRLAQLVVRKGLQSTSPAEQGSLVVHTNTAWTLPRPQAYQRFSTVAAALQDLVQTGRLRGDKTQHFAAQVLSAIQTRVQQEAEQAGSATTQPDSSPEEDKTNSAEDTQQSWAMPRGAYLWGTIGSGKTMLLDLFSTSFSEPDRTNLGLCRLHFHEFMLSVHRRLHLLQQSVPRIQGKSQFGLPVYRYAHLERHPVDVVAEDIASRTKVLCLDELHVSDVADALILSQLFSGLSQHGTFILFTSNKAPAELYKNGLNRQYFLPFVKLIQKQLAVVEVSGSQDYRLQQHEFADTTLPEILDTARVQQMIAKQLQRGMMQIGPEGQGRLEAAWEDIARSGASQAGLNVGFGRHLHIPQQVTQASAGSQSSLHSDNAANSQAGPPAALFDFEQLCGQQGLSQGVDQGGALGPADMVALAAAYPFIFIKGIPRLQWSQRNEARRLVTLLDTLYDMRCHLHCSAAGKPHQIFASLLEHARSMGINTTSAMASAATKLQQAETAVADMGQGAKEELTDRPDDEEPISLALLQEEVVMYQRAISRLHEMCKVQSE